MGKKAQARVRRAQKKIKKIITSYPEVSSRYTTEGTKASPGLKRVSLSTVETMAQFAPTKAAKAVASDELIRRTNQPRRRKKK